MFHRIQSLLVTGVLAAGVGASLSAMARSTGVQDDARQPEVDVRWLERMDKLDRALADDLIGFAPPAFRSDLTWMGDAATWQDFRGKVVVIQSWSSKSTKGRSAPLRAAAALGELLRNEDVKVYALHTPEGAENAATFLERRRLAVPVIIDSGGAFCDDLGMYTDPTNIVVDRNGVVRYAGLKADALPRAVSLLAAEPFDSSFVAPVKDESARKSAAEFPAITGTVANAADVRGQQAPAFAAEEWVTDRPDMNGKVVIVDFWATWCPPCIQSIPHMNDLANSFRSEMVCIGISDEQSQAFYNGMREKKLTSSDFAYALALDPRGRMKGPLRITGIPHCIVVSSDGIVRWQGHPASLRKETVAQIVEANKTLTGTNRPRRWGTKG